MSEKSTFFVDMTQFITTHMGSNLYESVGSLIGNIAPLFSIMFGIYLLMVMMSYWSGGGINDMFVDFIKRVLLYTFLIGLAFNASKYHELANIIYILPDDLAKSFSNTEFTGGALDKIVDEVTEVTNKLDAQQIDLSWTEIGTKLKYIIASYQIQFFMGILLTVMFAYYILAKVALAMVLTIGPIFIGFGLFPATRQYAMNWIGQCLNYVFNIVLLSIIGSMMLAFIRDYLDIMGVEDIGSAGVFGLILLMTLIVFVLLIWMTPQISSALTGGGAIQGSMRTMYNMARKGLSKAEKPVRSSTNAAVNKWKKWRAKGGVESQNS